MLLLLTTPVEPRGVPALVTTEVATLEPVPVVADVNTRAPPTTLAIVAAPGIWSLAMSAMFWAVSAPALSVVLFARL